MLIFFFSRKGVMVIIDGRLEVRVSPFADTTSHRVTQAAFRVHSGLSMSHRGAIEDSLKSWISS